MAARVNSELAAKPVSAAATSSGVVSRLEIDQPVDGDLLLRPVRRDAAWKSGELQLLEIEHDRRRRCAAGMRKPVRDTCDGTLPFLPAKLVVRRVAVDADQP